MAFDVNLLMKNSEDNLVRILFIHHSTGRRLINQGGVRALVESHNEHHGTNYEFWDHDYNRIGLVNNKGERVGYSFGIPDDNTNPDGLERLFTQQISYPPQNAFSNILLFDVIAFKSCFPVSAITSDNQLERYKQHYLQIREVLEKHQDKLFICMTPPPLIPLSIPAFVPAWTNPVDARRAREFANWMKSEDFLNALSNVTTFDFFDLLAGSEDASVSLNMLRPEYRGFLGLDSHPNRKANRNIGPVFVNFITSFIHSKYDSK